MGNRYVKEWGPFPSKSSDKEYYVKLRDDGRVSCNCGAWVFNRYPQYSPVQIPDTDNWWYDRWCPHLDMISYTEVEPQAASKEIVLARVSKVKEKNGQIFVPCYPITTKITPTGSRIELLQQQRIEHPLATIAYDLLQYGLDFEEIQDKFDMMPSHWTKKKVVEIVENKGKYDFLKNGS